MEVITKKPLKKIIGLRELREDTETYISAVKQGKEFTVVRKSQPIFKIVPVDEWGDEGVWNGVDLVDKNHPNGMSPDELLDIISKTM